MLVVPSSKMRVFVRIALGKVIAVAMLAVLVISAIPGCSAPPASSNTIGRTSGWQQYANTDKDSSIEAYEIGANYIRVRFNNNSVYLYTYASAGKANIERMKELAKAGDGLNSFIMTNVKYNYESKKR